ncbi:MAG: RDD family protein [Candidatus Aquicultor sp.]
MDHNLAGLWRRSMAFLLDGLLVLGSLWLVYLRPNVFPGLIDTRVLGVIVLFVGYEALTLYYFGATLGKLVLGVRIVDHTTLERPSLLKCFIRPLAKLSFGIWVINSLFFGFLAFAYTLVDFFRMLTDEQYQSVHDIVAGTFVLRSRRQIVESGVKQEA